MIILRGTVQIPPGWDTEDDQNDCFKSPSPYPEFQGPAWWTWLFDKGPNPARIKTLLRYSNHLEEEDHKRKFSTEERQGLTYYKSMLYRHLAIGDTTTGILASILAFNLKEKPAKWSPRPWLCAKLGNRQGRAFTVGMRMILYSVFLRPPIYAFTAVTSTKAIQEQMKRDPRMQRFISEDQVLRTKQLQEIAQKIKERTGKDVARQEDGTFNKDDDSHERAIREAQDIDRLARRNQEESQASDEDYYRIVGTTPEQSYSPSSTTIESYRQSEQQQEQEDYSDNRGGDALSGILGDNKSVDGESEPVKRGWAARRAMKKGEESAWEKLRRESSEEGTEWRGSDERKSWSKSKQSDKDYEQDKQSARAKAQAEFDAALEKERKRAAGEEGRGSSW